MPEWALSQLILPKRLAKLKTAIELVKSKGTDESAEHPSGVYYRKNGIDPKGKVVALFPGQGSQYVEMGIGSAIDFPEIRQAFAKMDSLFTKMAYRIIKNGFSDPCF